MAARPSEIFDPTCTPSRLASASASSSRSSSGALAVPDPLDAAERPGGSGSGSRPGSRSSTSRTRPSVLRARHPCSRSGRWTWSSGFRSACWAT